MLVAGPEPESFGAQLRRLRVRAGLSRDDLADRSGVSVPTILALELGRRRQPHPHTLDALAAVVCLTTEARAWPWWLPCDGGQTVLASWVVSGAAMLCVLALPWSRLTPFAYQCAFAGLVINLFNLIPLLELGGYYLLVHLLEMPLLRPRALAFVRRDLWRKLGTGQALDGEDGILGTFGAAAAAYSAFTVMQAAQFWLARIEPLVAGLGAMDPPGLRSVVIAAAPALGAGVAAALAAAGAVGGATVLADAPPARPECWVSGDLVGNSNPATIATALYGQ